MCLVLEYIVIIGVIGIEINFYFFYVGILVLK